jgi:predicted acyltransferase
MTTSQPTVETARPGLPDTSPAPGTKALARLASIDTYRGFVMLLMVGEVLSFGRVSRALPGNGFWALLAHHQDHVAWVGCSLHDLIQPGFSFLVGVALPFSIAARLGRGQSPTRMRLHAFWRALLLVVLGIFLRSVDESKTNFTFEDTLTQIGLGYGFLFLLAERSPKVQWTALVLILAGYWAAFALYPLPGPDFDWATAGVAANWDSNLTGFAAHWNKNTNLAWAFDTWFLNLFPRAHPFTNNSGGYTTLAFIPTLGTMLLGLAAGRWLRAGRSHSETLKRLAIAGLAGLLVGLVLNASGICPIVKRVWSPSWALFSAGWCFLFLTVFYWLTEVKRWRGWAFPLIVIGCNSIFIYCASHLCEGFAKKTLKTHLGPTYAYVFGSPYAPLVQGVCVLLIFWLVLFWLYRRKIFLKI